MGPNIQIYNSANSELVSTWNVGTVQAQVESSVLTVNLWNNKGGSSDVSDLKDCTVTVLDNNGSTSNEDVAKNKWVQVNVKATDSSTYTPIGGETTHPFRANTGVSDNTVKGTKNAGTNTESENCATINFKVVAPINSEPGSKQFKIRFTGYYT